MPPAHQTSNLAILGLKTIANRNPASFKLPPDNEVENVTLGGTGAGDKVWHSPGSLARRLQFSILGACRKIRSKTEQQRQTERGACTQDGGRTRWVPEEQSRPDGQEQPGKDD